MPAPIPRSRQEELFVRLSRCEPGSTRYVIICNALLMGNLRLVCWVASRYAKIAELPLDELFSDGVLRMMHLISKFDVHRGFAFSTYAVTSLKRLYQRKALLADREPQLNEEDAASSWQQPSTPGEQTRVDDSDFLCAVRDVLRPEQEELIQMHYHEDLSATQIGRQFGVTSQAVSARLSKAIRRMKDSPLARELQTTQASLVLK